MTSGDQESQVLGVLLKYQPNGNFVPLGWFERFLGRPPDEIYSELEELKKTGKIKKENGAYDGLWHGPGYGLNLKNPEIKTQRDSLLMGRELYYPIEEKVET